MKRFVASLLTVAALAVATLPAFAQDVVFINQDCSKTVNSGAVCQVGRNPIPFQEGNFLPAFRTVNEVEDLNPNIRDFLDADGNIPPYHFFRVG